MKGAVMNDLSLRNDIKDYLFDAINGKESYDKRLVVESAMTHFRQDQVFCDRFFDAFLRPVIMAIHGDIARKTRSSVLENRPQPTPRSIAAVSHPTPVIPKAAPARVESSELRHEVVAVDVVVDVQPTSNRWREWKEVDPETGIRKSVFKMNKRELLNAADARDAVSMTSMRTSALMRLMAGPLKNDDDLVETYWSSRIRHIDAMYQDIEVERSRFYLRSLMQGAA